MSFVLGVDVGGTFTDVVLGDERGHMTVTKVATTPDDPRVGVTAGVVEVLAARGVAAREVSRLVHGTTLATNVVLERKGSDVAFVTTEGFADLLRLGREFRQPDERFDLFFRPPPPPVPRERTFEVRERVDARGEVLVALAGDAIADVVRRVAASSVHAVAVCLLHAYANPTHEALLADALRAALPATTYVATSSEVWPELREYDRAMTTVMCAYVAPVMASYLAGLEADLARVGITCPVQIMESSGGVMPAPVAARRPIATVESGGAAGVVAAGFVGRLLGRTDVLSFDMGGTTAKTGIVRDGRPDVTHDFRVGGHSSAGGGHASAGYPVKIPVVDMAEVGAGGGSIASVDLGGALQVGPRSAGSAPGPACYGRGGTDPTVTDANLLLGYLHPGALSGGVTLSLDLARAAVEQAVGKPLDLDPVAASRAIHDLANATMAGAIRVVTVQRGIDPRTFTLVAFGGAGPMHAAELADTFGITEVVIPRAAGVASAIGLVTSDLTADRALTRIMAAAVADPEVIEDLFDRLEHSAASDLPAGPGTVLRSVDVRYQGQAHQLTVPAPAGPVTEATVDAIAATFRAAYRQAYGIDLEAPTELVTFRVRVVHPVPEVRPAAWSPATVTPAGERHVHFGGAAPVRCPVLRWDALAAGADVTGPAIVEGGDTTVAVPPGWRAVVDGWGNLVLTPSRDAGADPTSERSGG